MQASNRDNPIENNIAEIIHTLDKISQRLPVTLTKELRALTKEQYTLLTDSLNRLQHIQRLSAGDFNSFV
jgi:hypothetical protein